MNIIHKTLFDIRFSAVTQQEAVQAILQWTRETGPPKRVVTPNVNLTLLQQRNPKFRNILNQSSLCLVDGKPIYWASRLFRVGLPEVVTGSDLVPAVFATHQHGNSEEPLTVYLLGAGTGVAEKAAGKIMANYPSVQISGFYSPPFGFENDAQECEKICRQIKASKASLLVIGLGAPKQELWADKHLEKTGAKVAICAGATIDFLAGEKSRAPKWMSQLGLEWLHRACTEPRRLGKRYLQDGLALPGLFWSEFRKNKS